MECGVCDFVVLGLVVCTIFVYSVVAIGGSCVPASACVASGTGNGAAAFGCVTDTLSV
jgi:hypothetical protein